MGPLPDSGGGCFAKRLKAEGCRSATIEILVHKCYYNEHKVLEEWRKANKDERVTPIHQLQTQK